MPTTILFDVHRWADYPALKNISEFIYQELTASGSYSSRNAKRDRDCLRTILINLLTGWRQERRVSYSRAAKDYAPASRYSRLFLSRARMIGLVESLVSLGYVEHSMGYKPYEVVDGEYVLKDGVRSSMYPTDKLIALFEATQAAESATGWHEDEEVIIMRDKDATGKARQVEYASYGEAGDLVETRDIARARKRLWKLNAFLGVHDIALPSEVLPQVNARLERKGDSPLDMTRTHLVRVFNNRSWTQGGRFYRGFWQEVPRDFRKYISIGGETTVELDYKCLHPRILYAKKGVDFQQDAYSLSGYDPIIWRSDIKVALNIMINAKDRRSAARAAVQKINARRRQAGLPTVSWADVQDVFESLILLHSPIADSFCSGVGVRLQYEDSLLAERVMLELFEQEIICLPVHDSYIVQAKNRSQLEQAMGKAFRAKYGMDALIDAKPALGDIQKAA